MAAWVKFKSNNTYGAGKIRGKLGRLGAMQVVIHGPTETLASFSKRHAAGPWLEKLASDHGTRLVTRNAPEPEEQWMQRAACGLYVYNEQISRALGGHEGSCKRCISVKGTRKQIDGPWARGSYANEDISKAAAKGNDANAAAPVLVTAPALGETREAVATVTEEKPAQLVDRLRQMELEAYSLVEQVEAALKAIQAIVTLEETLVRLQAQWAETTKQRASLAQALTGGKRERSQLN